MKLHNNKFKKFIVFEGSTILDVMKVIDNNRSGFALIFKDNEVVGVVTDGDIRRQLLSKGSLNESISFASDFHFVDYSHDFEKICAKFRENAVDYLPILLSGKLYNILTKRQFHAMLLEGVDYSPDLDFSLFDNVILEHEIYNRPWGFYKSVWLNSHAQVKIITIFPDSELSLQKHFQREEHWIVVKGKGRVRQGEKSYLVAPGEYIYIPKECLHKIINISPLHNFILSEVQLGTYFGEEDIVRYSDKYGRE